MDKSALISIITVVYNHAEMLQKTIGSVKQQTYSDYEYVVIDGGSIDNSLDIIKTNEECITKWISETDRGIYDAMNKGTNLARGRWICFLNSGDVFVDEHSLAMIAENLLSNEDSADIIYGNILVNSNEGLEERVASEPCNKHRMYFCHQSAFIRTDLMRKYLYDVNHRFSADLKFFKQCYHDGYRFKHINTPFVIYDTTGVSNAQRQKGLLDNISVIKEVDKGAAKLKFLFRLYFTIYWRKLTGKS